MDTQAAPARRSEPPDPVEVEDAEAALVEHYPRLVRIAYLTLPAGLGLHRRVLLAHRMVQRALPRTRRTPGEAVAGAPDPAYALVRLEMLRGTLAYGRQRAGWRRWLRGALAAAPLPPQVVGLRLFPRAGGTDELALERSLARLDAPARAACALRALDGLDGDAVAALLTAAGAEQPRRAVRAANAAWTDGYESLLTSAEFDPCTVQARPTDLMRRRQHVRAGAAAAVAVAVCVALLGVPGSDDGGPDAAGPLGPQQAALNAALDPDAVVRAAPDAWQRAARLDFSVWPARGDRVDDRGLLRRALSAWARPNRSVRVTAVQGTPATPPVAAPHLLYAGDVDGTGVVLLYDGLRLARYGEPVDGSGTRALDFARVDGAQGASASAALLTRSETGARYLTAPWVDSAEQRDLLRPGPDGRALRRTADGVTDAVGTPRPASDGSCAPGSGASWPALVLGARRELPDPRTVVLTDLGDITPVQLTYAAGAGAHPADAAGPAALAVWSRTVCGLAGARGEGVRAVGSWQFADQQLPENQGGASWLCTRADTWVGTDRVLVLFLPPGRVPRSQVAMVSKADNSAACGPYQPRVLSRALWQSRTGHWFLLAAGSPDVASITADGDVRHTEQGHTFAAPARQNAQARLSARLTDGGTLSPLG